MRYKGFGIRYIEKDIRDKGYGIWNKGKMIRVEG